MINPCIHVIKIKMQGNFPPGPPIKSSDPAPFSELKPLCRKFSQRRKDAKEKASYRQFFLVFREDDTSSQEFCLIMRNVYLSLKSLPLTAIPAMNYFERLRLISKMFILASIVSIYSQNSFAQNPATVKGRVVDSISSGALSYATIQVFDSKQKKLVNGNVSADSGDFSIDIPFGRYYALIEFAGYSAHTTPEFVVSAQNSKHDLGLIRLASKAAMLNEVIVHTLFSLHDALPI